MPFIRPNDVDKEFYNLFLGKATAGRLPNETGEYPFVPMPNHKGASTDTLIRYFNRSGKFAYEDLNTYYPAITIQNFTPVKDKQRALFVKDHFIGNITDTTADKIYFPVALDFMYQVSAVANQESDFEAIKFWMLQNFEISSNEAAFLMNKVATIEDGDLGDVVLYTMDSTEQQRDDGRFEIMYTFNLKTYLHVKANETSEFITEIDWTILTPDTLPMVYDVVLEKFSVTL